PMDGIGYCGDLMETQPSGGGIGWAKTRPDDTKRATKNNRRRVSDGPRARPMPLGRQALLVPSRSPLVSKSPLTLSTSEHRFKRKTPYIAAQPLNCRATWQILR